MKKKALPLIIVLLAAGLTWYFLAGRDAAPYVIGEAQANVVPVIVEVGGAITDMNAELGQRVEAGDVLLRIDETNQQYAIEQLKISLAAAELKADTGSSSANSGVSSAYAAYNSAKAAAENARANYESAKALYEVGAIAKSELDAAELAQTQAQNAVSAAAAAVSGANAGYTSASSELNAELLRSQLAQAENTLDKYALIAPCSGVVITQCYTKGHIVAPGYTVVEIADSGDMQLLAYVPEDLIPGIDYGSVLPVQYNGATYKGTVCYIDVSTTYVPRDLQTPANKAKSSFKVKLALDSDCPIKAGEKAKIYFERP